MPLEVEKLLQDRGVGYRLVELSGRVITHDDSRAYTSSLDPQNDCKTIVVKDKRDHPHAFVLPGMMRVDFGKARAIVGRKVRVMPVEELKALTGKDPGAICPLLLNNVPIYVDQRVFEREKTHFCSGDPRFGLEMSPGDFERVMRFQIVEVVQA